MSTRWQGRVAPGIAITLGLVTLGLAAVSVVLDHLIHQPGTGGPLADAIVTAAGVVPVTLVGVLLAARQPRNPIGWILLAIILLEVSPNQYAVLDYGMHHGTLPLGGLAIVLQGCWPMFLVLITLLLWLFPDGKLPGGRWHRPAVAAAVAWLLVGLVASSRGLLVVAAHDVRLKPDGDLANPLPRGGFVLTVVIVTGTLLSWVSWLAVQIPAYRRASGERRQQFNWLYSGAGIFVLGLGLALFVIPLAAGQVPGWDNQWVTSVLYTLASAALPVCLGVAVLKYRLFELNRVISRVVSYTLLTALLGGVFAGLILLATHVLPDKGSVAVAVATLVIAALFNPLRRRVQHAVDRRFNRAQYDAEAIMAAFGARLRRTVDLDTIQGDLAGVVDRAFQPAHVTVWLPAGNGQRGSGVDTRLAKRQPSGVRTTSSE